MIVQFNNIHQQCEKSVVTAYQELKTVGVEEIQIFQSCIRLYLIYHPESSLSEARMLVSGWIDHHIYGNDQGKIHSCNCE